MPAVESSHERPLGADPASHAQEVRRTRLWSCAALRALGHPEPATVITILAEHPDRVQWEGVGSIQVSDRRADNFFPFSYNTILAGQTQAYEGTSDLGTAVGQFAALYARQQVKKTLQRLRDRERRREQGEA